MAAANLTDNQRISNTVEQRVGTGPTEIVSGWQSVIVELLEKMRAFLRPGAMVTFQKLQAKESEFFKLLSKEAGVPQSAVAIFLPPSVRQHMTGDNPVSSNTVNKKKAEFPDAGVLVASRSENHDVVVNVLFAHPPFTPAVDVYESGQFTAGYQYPNIDACRGELESILERHLGGPSASPSVLRGEKNE